MNTRPTVDDAEVQPAHSHRGTATTMMPTSAAPMPAPGSQIHIGSPRPHRLAELSPPRHDRGVGADAHEEGVTERHLAGDTGEQVDARARRWRRSPPASSRRIQSGSPRKRTIGSWLITGSENGSSTATSSEQRQRDALRPRREDRRLGLGSSCRGVAGRAPHTLLISGVPNSPYGPDEEHDQHHDVGDDQRVAVAERVGVLGEVLAGEHLGAADHEAADERAAGPSRARRGSPPGAPGRRAR